MRGLNGQPGWKYLFLIEGIMTLLAGFFAFRYMPPGPTQTRNWFTEREEGEDAGIWPILMSNYSYSDHGQ